MADEASSLWAWVTRYEDGTVGTIAAMADMGVIGRMTVSLIGRNRDAVVTIFGPIARKHAESSGQRVWLREYREAVDHAEEYLP